MSDIHDKNASPPPLCDLYFLDALHALNTAFKENIIRKDGEPDRLQLCYYAGQPIVSEQKNLIHLPVADFLPYFLSDRTRILPERLYLEEGVHPEEQVKEIEKLFYQLIEVIQDHRRGIQKQSLEHCDPICEDLLFENGEDALQEAMQQRLSTIYHPAIPALQICYYVGKPVAIKPIPDNLIHIPNSSLVNYFIATPNRHPTRFVGSSKNSEERQIFFIKSMKKIFENIKIKRRMFISALSAKLQERQPDFNGEMPYRIFLTASRYSTVTQYAVKNLMKAFSRLGCETFLLIEKDGMQDYGQSLSYPLKFLEFNPNVVVHINDPLNQYFHPDLINVVWYQDLVTSVTQHHPVIWRERDLVYATDSLLAREVKKCGEVACSIQFPCVDHWSMETNEPTRREEKIVFIGSSYDNRKYLITSMEVQKYVIYITRQLEEGILFDEIRLVELSREFSLSYFQAYKLFNAVVRNLVVSWVCKYSPIPVEIYGADWDTDFMVRPCWKGVLPHGPELYRVYRSAKYALEANATTLHSQRLAEMSLCGCIPVVYDSRAFVEDSPHLWDNEILFFASTGELCHCLTTAPKGDPRKIGADMTYERFAKRLLERFDTLIGRQKNLPNETLPNGLPHL